MGLGLTEWLIIGAIVLLLFGARKLPELAHSMGASVQSFKKGMRDSTDDASKSNREPKDKDSSGQPPTNGHSH